MATWSRSRRPMKTFGLLAVVSALALLLAACGGGNQQQQTPQPGTTPTVAEAGDYPNRTIEWYVGFAAGGGFDVAARTLADYMARDLGVNVVVRNIEGGGGRRAVQEIARGRPDGYSISIINMPQQIISEMLDPAGVDFNELGWIGRGVVQTYGVYTASRIPWTTIEDIRNAQPEPRYCLTGLSGHSFLVGAISTEILGIPWIPVTGYSAPEIRAALLRGDCELANGPIAGDTLTAVLGPDFKTLWMFTEERFPPVPDAPTIGELGYPDMGGAMLANNGLVMAPPGTPDAILDILAASLTRALQDPDVAARLEQTGQEVSVLSREETREAVRGMFQIAEEHAETVRARSQTN